ncbi:glycoside hydrolase family 43 protein [Echinicola sediminis]
MRDGDTWYLTGTAYPHWEGAENSGTLNPGVPLYKSNNLIDWEFVNYIVERPDSTKWYYRRFWAPEIHKIENKYYAILNCRNDLVGYDWQHIGFAVADRIEGPYKVVTEDKPLARGNDMTFFQDDDGKVYAFWHNVESDGSFWMGSAQIDLEAGEFLSEPVEAIKTGKVDYETDSVGNVVIVHRHGRNEKKIKKYFEWDSEGIEGAYVIKRNDTYYLFYSSWTRGYEIGYATANDINGPWKKASNNPIYGATSKKLCEEKGFVYEGNPGNPFYAVGHNEIFTGPDGGLWLSCHGQQNDHSTPFLVIDPLEFKENGEIIKKEPSYSSQKVTLK